MPDVIDRTTRPDADLYEADFYAWTQAQAQKLRDHSANAIDWDNLAEEIESVGRSEKREIRSRLIVLLTHLLKWEFQPSWRSHSWQSSIGEQRRYIADILEMSPSLWRFPEEALAKSFVPARERAAAEMGIGLNILPESCPYKIEDVLSTDFMPGLGWSPDDLIRD